MYLPWLSLSNFKICLMMHDDACNMKYVSVTNLQKSKKLGRGKCFFIYLNPKPNRNHFHLFLAELKAPSKTLPFYQLHFALDQETPSQNL